MSDFLKVDETITKADFTGHSFGAGEFESCRFVNCDFKGADLGQVNFLECEFEKCDLSNVKLKQTGFRDIIFTNCKLLGLRFDDCNPFMLEVQFENCILDLSSFYALNLKKTCFQGCQLHEVDFVEADLSESKFNNCDLQGALFERTNLQKADLRSASNYRIDPADNQIKKAKFSWPEASVLLDKYDITIST